jgi:hypothetical protein
MIKVNERQPMFRIDHDIFQFDVDVYQATHIVHVIQAFEQLSSEELLKVNSQFSPSVTHIVVGPQRQSQKSCLHFWHHDVAVLTHFQAKFRLLRKALKR